MKNRTVSVLLGILATSLPMSAAFAQQPAQPGNGEGQRARGREGGRGLLAESNTFKTDVPAHDHTLILVRPTPTSMTVSVVSTAAAVGYVEWTNVASDPTPGDVATFKGRTPERSLAAGEAAEFKLEGLTPATR